MITKKEFIESVKEGPGRPVTYNKEKHVALLYDLFTKGKPVSAFCAEANIAKCTFFEWKNIHPEFKEAYDRAINFAETYWHEMPANDPNFNFPYWVINMRNRFGFGKPKVRIVKDATPIARMNAIWDGLEEGELSAQEATQLSSVARTQADILANQKQGTEPFELETKEEIMAKVYAIQKVIDYKNGKL